MKYNDDIDLIVKEIGLELEHYIKYNSKVPPRTKFVTLDASGIAFWEKKPIIGEELYYIEEECEDFILEIESDILPSTLLMHQNYIRDNWKKFLFRLGAKSE